ncbi:MAG TPA: hypothetical protein VM865_02865, partial [Acidobacteriaceae bacterium]|nr:hypothetical protein [Acidobacteriaceae bacterium]
ELAFLQFPWRLLSVEAVVLSLAIALALHRLPIPGRSPLVACTLAIVLSAAASAWAITQFRQPCELSDAPRQRAALFHTGHGVPPTDEYTPADADNDVLRWGNPSFWLSSTPSGFAPGTIPNPAATIVNYDVPPPVTQTIAGIAPRHLVLHLTRPEILILNLRDFPSWRVTRNGVLIPNHLRRDDGLLAVDLPAGDSTVDVRWHRTWDQLLGDAITLLALLLWAALLRRSRTIRIWTA